MKLILLALVAFLILASATVFNSGVLANVPDVSFKSGASMVRFACATCSQSQHLIK